MRKIYTLILPIVLLIGAVITAAIFLHDLPIAVLNPKGAIAAEQRELMIIATLLMLVVVIPVFILTFMIAWKYRAGNTKAKYTPNWDHSKLLESLWWGIPFLIIAVLSVIIWFSTHKLDPYKPLQSVKDPVTVQVVALQWKWLFLYPEHGIATVNYVQFPEDTPINFELTADAPMNSFWIPQLGGQVYAMAGMTTKLHLITDETGEFRGSSANLSGEGFSGMKFIAEATTEADFNTWVSAAQRSKDELNLDAYVKLTQPTKSHPKTLYSMSSHGLYDTIIMKYMAPEHHSEGTNEANEEHHDSAHH